MEGGGGEREGKVRGEGLCDAGRGCSGVYDWQLGQGEGVLTGDGERSADEALMGGGRSGEIKPFFLRVGDTREVKEIA